MRKKGQYGAQDFKRIIATVAIILLSLMIIYVLIEPGREAIQAFVNRFT